MPWKKESTKLIDWLATYVKELIIPSFSPIWMFIMQTIQQFLSLKVAIGQSLDFFNHECEWINKR